MNHGPLEDNDQASTSTRFDSDVREWLSRPIVYPSPSLLFALTESTALASMDLTTSSKVLGISTRYYSSFVKVIIDETLHVIDI